MAVTSSPSQLIAEPNTILRCEVGSGVHGLAVDNQDDRDEMGICFEPPEYVIGLKHFEQWVFRTQPNGVRSGPGDLDLTIYSARKWCSLALKGNPTVLLPLFVPSANIIEETAEGFELRELAWAFASKRAGNAFLGYMQQQRQRLAGERGQKNVKRPELVDAYGFDTKYAGHIMRLGYQGIEYMNTGQLTLPMPEPQRTFIVQVRKGEITEDAVLSQAGILEVELKEAIEASPLPDEPKYEIVNRWLIEKYQLWWRERAERIREGE